MIIENKVFPNERDLYGSKNITLVNCKFDGIEDGESALKESEDIKLVSCYMNLRYPLWHDNNVILDKVEMTEKCRAALWYTDNVKIMNSNLGGIKALRECRYITIDNTTVVSPEFGWKSHNIEINNSDLTSEYLFLMASNIKMKDTKFKGKYSFQYVENALIEDSYLDTKDAFWHTKNVTVKNCTIKGEYLAWYSDGLTLINCKIIGTQPLCYCTNLKLIDCEMVDCDFSFEYSDVEATINSDILSIKNPKSGSITCKKAQEIILTDDSKYESLCKITETGE
ncbi:MAG: DUF3737 family protein [Acholeplasmatales bacterium]|nr:DUF3737 family protein [Acholeplasmatales bacterium]